MKAGENCLNVYQDYARLMGQDQIVSAIGGGVFGWPFGAVQSVDTGYLICYGTTQYMESLQYYGTQPIIMDVHLRPEVSPPDPVCGSLVRSEAQIHFDDIIHYLNLPFVPPSTIVVLGETWSSTSPTPCEGGPVNAAPDTAAGYNDSNLDIAGREIFFRPWMQLQTPSGDCSSTPPNQ
jgi:hypothetical protein